LVKSSMWEKILRLDWGGITLKNCSYRL
jgi:hypothetical protein